MDRERLLGGSPVAVIVRLAVISIVVGIIMSALDIRPDNILYHLRRIAQNIYALGFGAVESVVGYLLLGAVVVVPIWLIARFFGVLRSGGDRPR